MIIGTVAPISSVVAALNLVIPRTLQHLDTAEGVEASTFFVPEFNHGIVSAAIQIPKAGVAVDGQGVGAGRTVRLCTAIDITGVGGTGLQRKSIVATAADDLTHASKSNQRVGVCARLKERPPSLGVIHPVGGRIAPLNLVVTRALQGLNTAEGIESRVFVVTTLDYCVFSAAIQMPKAGVAVDGERVGTGRAIGLGTTVNFTGVGRAILQGKVVITGTASDVVHTAQSQITISLGL